MVVELGPHQTKALREMTNGCILKGGVGTGKSRTALAYYYINVCGGMPKMKGVEYRPMKRPRDIYIITTAKKRDGLEWEEEAAAFPISYLTDPNGVQLHVDSWNNITQYEMVEDAFFIFDEQRLVGSGSWVKAFLKIAARNQWIILSATPGDSWMDYIPVFLAHGFYKNRTEFVRRHVVFASYVKFPKVERYTDQGHLERLRQKIVVDMPYERHTIRKSVSIPVEYDQYLFERASKQRWNDETNKPIKDASEFWARVRKITNTDPSRSGALQKVLERHPKLIIFYNFDYELEMIRVLVNALNYPYAEWNGHKHQDIPKTDKWLYVVQYTAGAEGWNCIETNAIAFWSLNYSWKIFEQSKGRVDRLNTPFTNLYYYIFKSSSPVDKAIWQSLAGKETFNEKRYLDGLGWVAPSQDVVLRSR